METENHDGANRRKETLSIPVAIIIAGLIIAGAVYLKGGQSGAVPNGQYKVENTKTTVKPVTPEDHILGNPNAEFIVIEYSDIECPFCKNYHKSMQRLMNEYGKDGKVAWVYRHLPLEQLHKNAFKEAVATECAAKIGGKAKFWDYINTIFEITPSNDGLDLAKLPEIAVQLGLNKEAFMACLSSGEFDEKIRASVEEGASAGARGTPYSVIVAKNGDTFPIEGALPYASLKSVIDGLIKGE